MDAATGSSQAGRSRWPLGSRRRLGAALTMLLLLVVGVGWVLCSPLGGSPDDDYHLGSIWCPRPVAESCQTKTIDNVTQVLVPQTIDDDSLCYKKHPETSAACRMSYSDETTAYTARYDDGNYPVGYYRFHHALVGSDVTRSVILMRVVNVLIAVALLGTIALLSPPALRAGYIAAVGFAWIPMGVYFVASNNPSSWALTGVLAYASGLFMSLRAEGKRQWLLLGLGVVGSVLACMSRGDAAFFLFVVSLALLLGVRWRRQIRVHALVAAVVGFAGVWVMRSTGQGGYASGEGAQPPPMTRTRLFEIVQGVPQFLAGMYGRRWGGGWWDVPMDGVITIGALSLAGIALFMGVRVMTWRKLLSAGVILGALAGMPVVYAILNGLPNVYVMVQPRYVLPLLAVFYLVLFLTDDSRTMMTRTQAMLVVVVSTAVSSAAVHRLLLRYTQGIEDINRVPFNLDVGVQWWWNIPISPMQLWALVTACTLLASTMLVWLVGGGRSRPVERETPTASAVPTAESPAAA
ncbi:hypothetical protein DRB06_08460 [Actinomyces sp. Z5]|uniref:DUF2142 domain-containing protein n=1 Tax=Actinomyces sp. Z5 TaxID=2250216 RepID=UPI000DCE8D0E|nr:DUF2142 domain-containing protein [Actinomyces sp. Z5]RAX20524.1 hypothetical protein DRB06_08460 [Actinomyces sp. Z5]